MSKNIVHVSGVDCGSDRLFLISGPCVIEERDIMMRTKWCLQGYVHILSLSCLSWKLPDVTVL